MASPATTALPEAAPPDGRLDVDFAGTAGTLFKLSLWTGFLTVLTLGLYRFWMKTRLRRWYWSAIRPGGIPLEYTGLPSEKLLGFLVAVVILAFYIGVVNLVLMFASFSFLANNFAAYLVSFLGVIPIWFLARYRMRRYILGRTRWRGIRLGLMPGAGGYALRALGHWIVTLLTLGVLWPRMTFWLEKYRTDRTYFGSARLRQGGDWQMLMPHFTHALFGGAFTAAVSAIALTDHPQFGWLLYITVPWFAYGAAHYQARATAELSAHKTAGGLGLVSRPEPRRIARIYLFGTLGAALLLTVPLMAVASVIAALRVFDRVLWNEVPPTVLAGVGAAAWFATFLMWATLRHVLVLMPVWRHYAETLTLTGVPALALVEQRARDGLREAEGLAEALDVGAAI